MSHFTDLVVELFKRNDFSIITDKYNLEFKEQKTALSFLADNSTTELKIGDLFSNFEIQLI